MKKVAIVQSNYIPWKGYFDLIACVDEFILYDDMQYTRRDWRNRNKIKTPQGTIWLTIPVKVKGKFLQKIKNTEIDGIDWMKSHWKSIQLNYKNSPYYEEISCWMQPLYLENQFSLLSELNRCFIEKICKYLQIKTKITNSYDYFLDGDKTECLVNLCLQSHANEYISGPAAKNYLDKNKFKQKNINVSWFDYSQYPEYPQLWNNFTHEVSIIDLLFNCGQSSIKYMQYSNNLAFNSV